MSRTITAATKTESLADAPRPILMLKLEYEAATVFVHTGAGTITFSGDDYLGVGGFGTISDVVEDGELSAATITATLSGVQAANISNALSVDYQGRPATLYLGFLDSNYALVADPTVIFKGTMDNQVIDLGKDGTIHLTMRNRLADWGRARIRRYNNTDQQMRYPGDEGLEFVEQAVEKQVNWGIKGV